MTKKKKVSRAYHDYGMLWAEAFYRRLFRSLTLLHRNKYYILYRRLLLKIFSAAKDERIKIIITENQLKSPASCVIVCICI